MPLLCKTPAALPSSSSAVHSDAAPKTLINPAPNPQAMEHAILLQDAGCSASVLECVAAAMSFPNPVHFRR